jgi:diketogulonate reductase-like aldo/keto reductase
MSVPAAALGTTPLPTGEPIPVLGQAARRALDAASRREEIAGLRHGIDLGMTLIDAAPDAEQLAAEAIVWRRDDVFLVAKLAPREATADAMAAACAATLRRLGTDRLDLYLLHGRGDVSLVEAADGFAALREAGLIRHWGVADFGMTALAELLTLTSGCAAVEVRYDLARRAAEWDLLDRCRQQAITVLAYTSLEFRGSLRLHDLAARHRATPAQVALAWLLSHEGLAAVVPAESPEQAEEHRAAAELPLDGHDYAMLDDAFPPPLGPQPLEPIAGT